MTAPAGPVGWVAPALLVWVPAVLLLDRTASPRTDDVLGVLTWALLLAVLVRQSALVRAQTAVVVAFATAVEYTFSPLLHVYEYRLHAVPAFVPPGHGLVYLAAFALGGTAVVRRHVRTAVALTAVAATAYAAWGLSPWAPRPDVLGAFWCLCLLGFLWLGRSRQLYVGAFVVVTYLELVGTGLGNWAWAPRDPTGLVPMGNPPSGAAGGYGWFDLAAVYAAPLLLVAATRVARVGTRLRGRRSLAAEPAADYR